MKPAVVVDVGNSRMKWGRCTESGLMDTVALSAVDPAAWQTQREAWGLAEASSWAVSGVHPQRRDALVRWLRERGDTALVLDSCEQMPLHVKVDQPGQVGMDRLLNAVAANARRLAGASAVIVDAGTAVTVDWLDPEGIFCGGAIFPGLRLMARALHDHTAQLPLVEGTSSAPPMPGPSTVTAIQAGVFWAVAGGIKALADQLFGGLGRNEGEERKSLLFLTGGDGPLLEPALLHLFSQGESRVTPQLWPQMTLEGIRLAARALP